MNRSLSQFNQASGGPDPAAGGAGGDNAVPGVASHNHPGSAAGADSGLALVAQGFVAPVDIDVVPDGSGRLFVSDRPGVIYIVDANGQMMSEPFLDIRDRMVDLDEGYEERGLLGLAFHPDFANNGRFFVYYTPPPGPNTPAGRSNQDTLSEFAVRADNPNAADPNSERVVLSLDDPHTDHNGGDITFGPDGYLYIPIGDGGGANDEGDGHTPGLGNGQDVTQLFGKILRIDVNSGDPYGIPADNPLASDPNARPEIFAYGFRNPWQVGFDLNGNLYVADAGQDLYEEVSLVTGPGGNYGWRIKEGTHCFDPASPENPPATCPTTGAGGEPLIDPVIEFDHSVGATVVGGAVYSGPGLPDFNGQYFFGTWADNFEDPTGKIFVAQPADPAGGLWPFQQVRIAGGPENNLGLFLLAISSEPNGDLYVLTTEDPGLAGTSGKVWRLVSEAEAQPLPGGGAPSVTATPAADLSATPTPASPTPGGDQTATAQPTATGDDTGMTDSIAVSAQAVSADNTLTIDRVTISTTGWVVIHLDSAGTPGTVIGWAQVQQGTTENVAVPVQTGGGITPTVHVMLHIDAGTVGTYEFPGVDGPLTDAAGNIIMVPMQIDTGASPTGTPATGTPEATAEGGDDTSSAPAITVQPQAVSAEGTLTIGSVSIGAAGWVVIHLDDNGAPGTVIGWSPVPAGTTANIEIPVQAENITPTVHVMLHTDAGEVGTYEFPGPDVPVTNASGAPVMVPLVLNAGGGDVNGTGPCTVTPAGDFTVNVRNAPDMADTAVSGTLGPGQTLTADGQYTDAGGFAWWRTTAGSWVRQDVVNSAGNCQDIGAVTP